MLFACIGCFPACVPLPSDMAFMADTNMKDGILLSKRPCFALQKTAFYTLKGGLLERERPSFVRTDVNRRLAENIKCVP